jgi:hypothetical protein
MKINDADELDRMLVTEESLAPSSGFAAAVMEGVREAAMEPPPLPFPWTRVAAGAIACAVSAAAGTSLIDATDWSALFAWPAVRELADALRVVTAPDLGYAAAAVFGSVALLLLPRRSQRRPPTSSR